MIDRRRTTTAVLVGLGLAVATAAWAERPGVGRGEPPKREGLKRIAAKAAALQERLPEHLRTRLSSGARALARIHDNWDTLSRIVLTRSGGVPGRGGSVPAAPGPSPRLPAGRISDPTSDVAFSSLGAYTQNETSTAWCSPNMVVGFNDSGSFFESFVPPGVPTSFNGISRSTTNGGNFTDLGFLTAGADPNLFLSGDPVLGCTDQNTFYYASLLEDYGTNNSAISVSKSTDGGLTWGNPVPAAAKPSFVPNSHFLDKEWMAVDPANPNNIYVTYTDFDSSFPNSCSSITSVFRVAIELVRSTDAGATWGAPLVIDNGCTDTLNQGNQGSQVAIGPNGEVYIAYEHFQASLLTGAVNGQIDFVKSTDGGSTFGPPLKVAGVNTAGLTIIGFPGFSAGLQGAIRMNEFPSLAVDRSTRPTRGNIYLTWNDPQRTVSETFIDLAFFGGVGVVYNFSDIVFAKSTDGGTSFSHFPIQVNNNSDVGLNEYTDQFEPGIAVDKAGKIGICFYDRRKDLHNFLIDRECATSSTAGEVWVNVKKTPKPFMSTSNQDNLLATDYMGDYDSLASDGRSIIGGFRGAFGDNGLGNPDVKLNSQ